MAPEPPATRRIWILYLVLPFRFGRPLTGLLLLALLVPCFNSGWRRAVTRVRRRFISVR